MSTSAAPATKPKRSTPSVTISGLLIRLVGLGIIDIFAIWLITSMVLDGYYPLAAILGFITIFVNVVFLREGMYPLRWMVIGLSLMLLISVYPILYTVFIAFTNYGDGHLLTQPQVNQQFESQQYLPEAGGSFSWTAFESPTGEYALWLQDADGNNFFVEPGVPMQAVDDPEATHGAVDGAGIPQEIEGYKRLSRIQSVPIIDALAAVDFGEEESGIVKVGNLDTAGNTQPRYAYNEANDTLVDKETGTLYTPAKGLYTECTLQGDACVPVAGGNVLTPGFWVGVGLENFTRFFSSSAISGPLVLVTIWNFVFAFLTVLTTFFLGLFTAMLFNDLPGRRIIRSLLIIPYTIPSLVTILVWRGMLNEQLGVITNALEAVIGFSPPWFTDPTWAKIGILMVNLWLGYPYFMLVCSGALQGIPTDIYSAADVDGANAFQKFRRLTLPLLLIATGPLLIASFTFNFNNFNVIFLYNEGGPPIAGSPMPVGHTDILISFVYKLAFGGARGADYGFASAITIIIFAIVVVITLMQFRFTNMWEAGEDV